MEDFYPIQLADGFAEMNPKMAFIQSETGNLYRTARIVKELFDGKSMDEAIEIVKKIENVSKSAKGQKKKEGCYIATMIYGSYHSDEVISLRLYRDTKLSSSIFGRIFIKIYYLISPLLVMIFEHNLFVHRLIKVQLDKFVKRYKGK